MGTVNFKNVGQGDSIIVEWESEGKNKIGIIDCNLYENKNPVLDYLDYLTQKSLTEIEFVVLSHFHYDHFSGMPQLFKFCIDRGIKIKWFLHTFVEIALHIYKKIEPRKKIEQAIIDFFNYVELSDKIIINDLSVNSYIVPIKLSDKITMTFLGPSPKTGSNFAKLINRKVINKEFTYNDINKFSTIIYIECDKSGILLTSDSVIGNYRNLQKKINKEIILTQAPHHGSSKNVYTDFWKALAKKEKCPVVFSVGYEPKDKLPNKDTVEFFDKLGFEVHSTNSVYGISEYFNQGKTETKDLSNNKTHLLNHFSKKTNTIYRSPINNPKYEGDQKFAF